MNPHHLPFGFQTRRIIGINFSYPAGGSVDGGGGGGGGTTGNPPTQPSNIYTCPSNARARLRGFVFGPAGQLAYFAVGPQQLASFPADQHGMFPDALVVPCGHNFDFVVNHEQTLWAVASMAPNLAWGQPDGIVYASYNYELHYYSDAMPSTNGGYEPDTGGDFHGPQPGWRKRGMCP